MVAFDRPQIKKVAVIGPECSGKSDLSQFLADHYKTAFVPEYARAYLDRLIQPYVQSDLTKIANGQLRLEYENERDSNRVMICDTNLYVIKIWSEFKFGEVDKEILHHIETEKYDLYLLTYIDIPWQDDPQREHPDKREELYQLYLNEMKNQSTPFVEIKGERDQRRKIAVDAIDKMLLA
ncbi:MAG TPA: ATP-binding protein [Chryseolinea sp.]|nr:ATP-binding protein [Chryseolinea sp.]HPM29186.1 ATP-binding protein [Chryseolinea sp.]